MRLREIAHSRTGDKGDTSNISVIAYDPDRLPAPGRARDRRTRRRAFRAHRNRPGRRYELPNVGALNFVLEGALAGGVTRALTLDAHGKSLSSLMLELEI